jgi:hypothetical protein
MPKVVPIYSHARICYQFRVTSYGIAPAAWKVRCCNDLPLDEKQDFVVGFFS